MYKFLNEVQVNHYTQEQLEHTAAVLAKMYEEGAMFVVESRDIAAAVVAGLITEANAADISLGRFGTAKTKEGLTQLTMIVSSKSTGTAHGAMMRLSDTSLSNLHALADQARSKAFG